MGPNILIYFAKGLNQFETEKIKLMLQCGFNVTIKRVDNKVIGLPYDKFYFDELKNVNVEDLI